MRLFWIILMAVMLIGCGSTTPPPTPVPPTSEPSPTETPLPPTNTPSPSPTPTPRLPTATFTPSPSPTPQTYTVAEGDTLLGIALEFETSVEALAAANGIGPQNFLQVGQELLIPSATPAVSAGDESIYVVEAGDTLLGIALARDTTVEALAAANGIGENDFLQVGQELIIPDETEVITPTLTATLTAAPSLTPTEPAVPRADAPPPEPATPAGPPAPAISHAANINPLTGLPVADPDRLRRRPILVRIGNDAGARQSQVGLNSAEVVYEEITEWWVTRFTAIFLYEAPPAVGPVRSARLMNVQLAPQYQGALAHSGGSDPVRWEISQAPIANLDEYYNAQPYFYREGEGWQTRLALDVQAARDYMAAKNLEAAVSVPGFLFEESIETGEPGEDIYVPYPAATSFTEWHYDAASGHYLRWINGDPLTDVAVGQVAAANVIIYFAEHQATEIVEDANGATSIRIVVNGRGPAWFFRDGLFNQGQWQTDGTRPPYFTYTDGRPYPLKPGNTWIEVVPLYYSIGVNDIEAASSAGG